MNKEELIKNKYKLYDGYLFQKKIGDYYINIREYTMSSGWSYTAEIQIDDSKDSTFNVEILNIDNLTIKEVESFFNKISKLRIKDE